MDVLIRNEVNPDQDCTLAQISDVTSYSIRRGTVQELPFTNHGLPENMAHHNHTGVGSHLLYHKTNLCDSRAVQQSLQAPIYAHGVTSVAALSAQVALLQGQINVAVLSKTGESTLQTSYQQVTGIFSMVQAFKQLLTVTGEDLGQATQTVRQAFRVAVTELNQLSSKCQQIMEDLNGSFKKLQQLSINATSFTAAQQVRSQFAKYGPHGFVQSGQEKKMEDSARVFRVGLGAGLSQGAEYDDVQADSEMASMNLAGGFGSDGFDQIDVDDVSAQSAKRKKIGRPKQPGTPPFGRAGPNGRDTACCGVKCASGARSAVLTAAP